YLYSSPPPRAPHSFPTRRSSDLKEGGHRLELGGVDRTRVPRRRLHRGRDQQLGRQRPPLADDDRPGGQVAEPLVPARDEDRHHRSEEHTSELQSLAYLVCRLLLE